MLEYQQTVTVPSVLECQQTVRVPAVLQLECQHTVIVRMPATKSHCVLSLWNVVSLCLPDILKCMEALCR